MTQNINCVRSNVIYYEQPLLSIIELHVAAIVVALVVASVGLNLQ